MQYSASLRRLIDRVAALDSYTSESLAGALDTPLTLNDITPWVAFDPSNYRRNLVFRDPRFELRVLCWLPSQRTSLHGHDGSACAFRILCGASTEIRLRQPDQRWVPGQIVPEICMNLVHQVTNLGDEPLVSIHAYAPALEFDQPPPRYQGRHIVIVGGAVSGAALAIHLLERAKDGDLRITIVERRHGLGHGPAFGTTDPAFRLNVPADRMSVYPDRPLDFVEWATPRLGPVAPTALLPRQLFGEYVEERLAQAIASTRSAKVWFHRSEAVAASADGVRLSDGTRLATDAVVLATGNQLPAAPAALAEQLMSSPKLVRDPWSDGALAAIVADDEVLLVGTGLTAVDVVLALVGRGHRAPITATSRRGLLPRSHLDTKDPRKQPVTLDPAQLPRDVAALCRWLRREVVRCDAAGIGWQCVIDALRPHTTRLWETLSPVERRRFMRRLRPYWEVLRHRAAPDALVTVERLQREGRFAVTAGDLTEASEDESGFAVCIVPRGDGPPQRRRFARIILCTGPQTDVTKWPGALFRQLLRDQQLSADPLGLGILSDVDGRALDATGNASPWLYAIGSLRRPRLWETTAVPDLVRQAVALATLLTDSGGRDEP